MHLRDFDLRQRDDDWVHLPVPEWSRSALPQTLKDLREARDRPNMTCARRPAVCAACGALLSGQGLVLASNARDQVDIVQQPTGGAGLRLSNTRYAWFDGNYRRHHVTRAGVWRKVSVNVRALED